MRIKQSSYQNNCKATNTKEWLVTNLKARISCPWFKIQLRASLSILAKNGRINEGSGENMHHLDECARDVREERGENDSFCTMVYHYWLKIKTVSDSTKSLLVCG
jgi:hypothetical protein